MVTEAILNRAPTAPIRLNPQLPAKLEEIINNALEKDRELRYQSAAEIRANLKRLQRGIGSSSTSTVVDRAEPAATVGQSRHQLKRDPCQRCLSPFSHSV